MKKSLEERLEKNLHWQSKLKQEEKEIRAELKKFDPPVKEEKKLKKIVQESPAN